MSTPQNPADLRLDELKQTGEAIGKLAEDAATFTKAAEAFRAKNAETFQSILGKLELIPFCELICRWFCSKHCVFVCSRLCPEPIPVLEPAAEIAEMREFAQVTQKIAADAALLADLIKAVDAQDQKAFHDLISRRQWERFCHQICHYICAVRCKLVCRELCPRRPIITEVGFIPTSQIDSQGRAAGQSLPPGPTPFDNKPNGVGDHPFGGLTNIKGSFNIANPLQYKVEFSTSTGGPWAPIFQAVNDYHWCHGGPITPIYTRVPDAGGWYNVSEMDCDGQDYLTDWSTPSVRDQLYYLKLTVRNTSMVEFSSPLVAVRVDNGAPTSPRADQRPLIQLQLQTPDGKRRKLGCCEKVERGDGNLLVITLQAWDENFSSIGVSLLGGCGVSFPIIDTGGNPLSKTYNGNVADLGYPVPTDFLWNPWDPKFNIDPCCYLIDVRIYDRVIGSNYWGGGHSNENWQSITIV